MKTKQSLKEKNKEKTKELIFEVATKLFKENGYNQTSVSQICDTVGIAKGTYYLYFHSKEDIIRASFSTSFNDHLIKKLCNVNYYEPKNYIKSYIMYSLEYCDIVGKQTTTHAFIFNLNLALEDIDCSQFIDDPRQHMKDAISFGIKNNCFKNNFTVSEFYSYIRSFICGLMIKWCYDTDNESLADINEKIVTSFIDSL